MFLTAKILVAITSLTIFACASDVIGQRRRPAKRATTSPKSQEKETAKHLQGAFDPLIERLPVPLLGHDVRAIVRELEKRQKTSKKGEFETTDAYHKRLESERRTALPGNLLPSDLLAVVFRKIESKYDADQRVLNVTVPLEEANESGRYRREEKRQGLRWSYDVLESSSYVGTNAFGASKTIEKFRSTDYWVVFSDPARLNPQMVVPEWARELSRDYAKISLAGSFAIEPADAIIAKQRIHLLVIGRLATIPLTEGLYYHDPKINEPRDTIIYFKNLVIDPEEAWIFDSSTGHIYAKLKRMANASTASPSAPSPSPSPGPVILRTASESVNRIKKLYDEGQDDLAVKEIRQLLILEPTTAEAFLIHGKIKRRQGDQEGAIASFKTAIFWDDKLTEAYIELATLFFERGDLAEARKYVTKAIELDPGNERVLKLQRQLSSRRP